MDLQFTAVRHVEKPEHEQASGELRELTDRQRDEDDRMQVDGEDQVLRERRRR